MVRLDLPVRGLDLIDTGFDRTRVGIAVHDNEIEIGVFGLGDRELLRCATGQAALAVIVASLPTPTGMVPIMSGETWHFQAWHRDTVGGAATSNFSTAQRALFH